MEGQPRTTTRPSSGIPRLAASRLPLPTSTASKSLRPSPSRDRLQADPGLDHNRLRRPSRESLLKQPSPRYSNSPSVTPSILDEPERGLDDIQVPEEESVAGGDDESGATTEPRGRLREVQPSLSERTIETIAHIPPSPASVKRQSSFFNGASPIRSPSRTPSNVSGYSRSPSRSSSGQASGNDLVSQPVSKLRLPSRSRMSMTSSASLSTGKVSDTNDSPSKMRLPSARQSLAGTSAVTEANTPLRKTMPGKINTLGVTATKGPVTRPSLAKKPSKSTFSEMGPPERPLQVRKTRKPQTDSPSASPSGTRSPSTASRYVSAASTLQDELTPEQQAESEARKASKSSSALRESIAKAKAARKAAACNKEKSAPTVNAAATWNSIDVVEDPFNQLPKGSSNAVLQKRIEGARASGTLNIAALSLTEIPKVVIDMYEYDPDHPWFESVDLIKFIAADNDLTEVSDATFPDIDPEQFDPDSEERGLQFGGVETLDLHGNRLQSLPIGLRRLHNLRFLNLSNNDFTMERLEIIFEIPSLVDLKLANNNLKGALTSEIGRLRQLEGLDLRGNALTVLPQEIAELTSLKVLEIGENHLASLPFEILSKLPLKTLHAPKNKLEGTLIPESVDRFEDLQSLNIANNFVDVFAANPMLYLPSLRSLFIGVNRIKQLPSVSSWQSLSVLSAEDNSLTDIPAGFVELKNLKNVDFTGNNLTRLDDKIGIMENLSSFRVANNPLRERKFLSMGSEEIIQDLRNRCEPDQAQETDDEGSVATQFTLAPEAPEPENTWRVKPGGVVDRSYSDLTDLEPSNLELIQSEDVRCLYLQHNDLRSFPVPAISFFSQSLVELDLSHNPLDSSVLISASFEMPKLQTLNLIAASLTSLEPLLTNLQAPSLNFLDVSNNRLTGTLPHIRQTYPDLKTFIASDNQFASLEFEAVQGLQVLDVSNNDIDYLPPKIGLLGAERSPQNWGTGSSLRRFEVAGNRFRVPRWQVVAKGTESILEFLKEHIPAQDLPVWEHEDAAPVDEY
ncbi:hypothetical protein N7462_006308 [Penicillium macrosclerotiorum]|uniref:uncharacterized protein n=1 Tax=Penicillium macrosclerotiorum TaxID=303699 RepID=UPI002546A7E5|nr:uncharacterized protein N7462_006308 [Penicillium macrosclerotiorum]KAJ5683143.1 hypothetical protein N7462_006308 [Penicillium macrosclerotiorum]